MKTKITSFFSDEKHQTLLVYCWFLFLCFLCYGILIPTLGFYWDDLPILFSFQTTGAGGFPEYLASDRPFSAWNFMLTTSLFKFNPLGYHILAFILRYLSVILFYQIVRLVWTNKAKTAAVAASIFAVYPGFLQQPIALIYCHHLSVFCLQLLSFYLMLKLARSDHYNWFFGIVSWAATLHMFSIENFATLEMVRPVLLWIVLTPKHKDFKDRALTVLKQWAPYLAIFSLFMIWRVFIFKFPTYEPDLLEGYETNPISTLTSLLVRIPQDFYTTTVRAWLDSFTIPVVSDFGTTATRLFWALIGITLVVSATVLAFLPKDKSEEEKKIMSPELVEGSLFQNKTRIIWLEWLAASVLLYFLAASIVWVLELPLEIKFAWDRMTLAFIPFVALLAGVIYIATSKMKFLRNLFFCLLIAAAVGSHFENAMSYKRDWEDLQDFLWQLSWRMPNLEPGSTVMGSTIGLDYYSDNSLTAPLNLMYAPDSKSYDLNYVFYYTDVRVGSWLPSLEEDLAIRQPYRSYTFEGSTNNVIAIKYDPPSCVQVMDRVYANSVVLPNLTEMQVDEMRLTNLSLIQTEPASQPFAAIFGSEPQHDWCYYFEKGDLSRQYAQYEQTAALGEEAITNGFAPRAASEWLPFLESNIRIGNWERVDYLAEAIDSAEGNYTNGLCSTLKRLSNDEDIVEQEKLVEYMKDYNCP